MRAVTAVSTVSYLIQEAYCRQEETAETGETAIIKVN